MPLFYRPLAFIALMQMVATLSAQPNWTVTPANFQYTMTVVAVADLGCVESLDENDLIAAFIDGEVRGVQALDTEFGGRQFSFMIVYDNDIIDNTVTFKLYDASSDTVVDGLDTLHFLENRSVGDVDFPFVVRTVDPLDFLFHVADSIPTQAVAGDTAAILYAVNVRPDTLVLDWTFIEDAQGPDNTYFTLSGNALVLEEDVNVQLKSSYQVHLTATAGGACALDTVLVLPVAGAAVSVAGADARAGDMAVFPNPVSHTLRVTAGTEIGVLRLYDMRGGLLYSAFDIGLDHAIDVSGIADQVVMVVCQRGNLAQVRKVLVRH